MALSAHFKKGNFNSVEKFSKKAGLLLSRCKSKKEESIEETIKNIGVLSQCGMKKTDEVILDIMNSQKS